MSSMKYAQLPVAFTQMWCSPGAASRGGEGTMPSVADVGILRKAL
jgi:hypothetical protein